MYINNIFFILYSISIIFTILWTLVFKYFILNKIMLFRIEANEYLRENRLFMPQNFLKKQFYKTAGWYAIWSIPIILFHTALALWGLLGQSSSLLVNILSITNILAMPITVFTNYRFLLIKNHFDFSRKVIPVVHLNTTPFFASANDTNIEEASKFNLMLNDCVLYTHDADDDPPCVYLDCRRISKYHRTHSHMHVYPVHCISCLFFYTFCSIHDVSRGFFLLSTYILVL
ncbi:hypothetical protein [Metamycoplasma hyosynoviae]|uniref:hypothetical protein n=1 Tax=Metamycoplasma hyosynoviae TaxID=29559 RepID=UPI00235A1CDC|nr:hypothetical protein [Metamycoplasma hyosynoviae]MDC8911904.1 hypothetical protein [Metamycoplasma hyosynoviae]